MNVSSWSIRNPIPAIMLFVLLTLAGALSFKAMKIQNFPDLDLPTISVVASLPGASPAQLETEVARKIENSLAAVQGLKHIYSKIQDGTVTITAEFRLEKGTQEALDEVRDAVNRVRSELPGDLRGQREGSTHRRDRDDMRSRAPDPLAGKSGEDRCEERQQRDGEQYVRVHRLSPSSCRDLRR